LTIARWVDSKFYTFSGITAGIDMTLSFVKYEIGIEAAEKISHALEYIWNRNSEDEKVQVNG
jgi:transcriptional regulator GlxA family with amidase domain